MDWILKDQQRTKGSNFDREEEVKEGEAGINDARGLKPNLKPLILKANTVDVHHRPEKGRRQKAPILNVINMC
jgi:hypothetical protein